MNNLTACEWSEYIRMSTKWEKKTGTTKNCFLYFLLSFFSFPHHPPYLALAVDKSCMVFISIHVCLRISKEKLEGLWTGYQSLGMHRKQNFKLVFGFKNDLASPSIFFHFSCLIVFLLLCIWLHFGGKRYLGKLSWSCDYIVHSLFQALR